MSLLANITSDQGFVDNTGFEQQKVSVRYDDARGFCCTIRGYECSSKKEPDGSFLLCLMLLVSDHYFCLLEHLRSGHGFLW